MINRILSLLLFAAGISAHSLAQEIPVVKFEMERLNDSTVRLYFDVKASSGIRIYRLPEGQDVLYSEIDFDST